MDACGPVEAACRAELRWIGHALHAASPDEDFVALSVESEEIDPTHSGWRAIVLEMAWGRDRRAGMTPRERAAFNAGIEAVRQIVFTHAGAIEAGVGLKVVGA